MAADHKPTLVARQMPSPGLATAPWMSAPCFEGVWDGPGTSAASSAVRVPAGCG
jgi:hypothetical protein